MVTVPRAQWYSHQVAVEVGEELEAEWKGPGRVGLGQADSIREKKSVFQLQAFVHNIVYVDQLRFIIPFSPNNFKYKSY